MKPVNVKNPEDAKTQIPDIEIVGDPNAWRVLSKASSKEGGWMKSTKAMIFGDGCLVQVSTQIANPDGSYSIAEALTYVPNITIPKIRSV